MYRSNCPICNSELIITDVAGHSIKKKGACPIGSEAEQVLLKKTEYLDDKNIEPTEHMYEYIYDEGNSRALEFINVPPYATDNVIYLDENSSLPSTILWIWAEPSETCDDIGWTEIEGFPYIPPGPHKEMVQKIERLLPFL